MCFGIIIFAQNKLMKKILYIILFFISVLGYSQQEANRFVESENADAITKDQTAGDLQQTEPGDSGGGDPADPAPIDDYIPLLLVVAVGIIGYSGYRKRASL